MNIFNCLQEIEVSGSEHPKQTKVKVQPKNKADKSRSPTEVASRISKNGNVSDSKVATSYLNGSATSVLHRKQTPKTTSLNEKKTTIKVIFYTKFHFL